MSGANLSNMGRIISFIASGVFTLFDGVLGILATVWPPTDDAAKAHFLDGVIAVTALAIASLVSLVLFEKHERDAEKAQREDQNRMIAELHAKAFSNVGEVSQPPQAVSAQGAANPSPTIAQEVALGNVFVRFEREGVPTLREAGLHLAKKYRDFANANKSDATRQEPLLTAFWSEYPFRELSSVKDRIENVIGFQQVNPSTEVLPSTPENILRLAKHLEKDALKVPADVPL